MMSRKAWGVVAVAGLCVTCCLVCSGFDALLAMPLQLAAYLAFGWVPFLGRVLPKVSLDGQSLALAGGGIAGLAVGLHFFLRRMRGEMGWRMRWTGMILAGVVLMFVAGIAAVGIAHQTGWLLRSREPLFSSRYHPAQRMQSMNNLKQMGLAVHNHIAEKEPMLPPGGTFDARGNGLHGWQTMLLPYIEQEPLYRRIDMKLPWNDPANAEHFQTVVKTYIHPGGKELADEAGFALSHYAANVHVMGGGPPRTITSITDGTGNTILIGEAWAAHKPWGHHANWRDPTVGLETTPDSFGSPMGLEVVLFVMADGSTRTVSKSMSLETLRAAATPDAKDELGEDW